MPTSLTSRKRGKVPQTKPRPLDRDAKIAVGLFFLGWVMSYADRQLITLALPFIGEDLQIDHTQQGLLISAFFLAYAGAQIPGGLLADRFGAKRMAVIGITLWSILTIVTGLSGAFAVLLLARFLFGLGEGVFPGAAMKAISERTTPDQRMTANGWLNSSNSVGTLVAAVIGATLIASVGWQWAFIALGALGFIVAVALKLWLPGAKADVVDASIEDESGDVRPVGRPRDLLRSPTMWGFTLMFFGYGIVAWGLGSWSASYLVNVHGVDIGQAAGLSLAPLLAGGVAAVIGGKLSDRFGGRHRPIVIPAMLVTAACLFTLTQSLGVLPFIVMMTLTSFFLGLCYTPIFGVPMRSLPTSLAGIGSAMIIIGSQIAGIVTPTIMGAMVDAFSYEAAFGVLLAGPAVCIAFALIVPSTSEKFLAALRLPGYAQNQQEQRPVQSVDVQNGEEA